MSVSFKCVLIALVGLCAIASSGVECRPTVITEANWESLLDSGEWMVEFYAPWCPACNRFSETWNQFSSKADELGIHVGAADVNANPVLSGLFTITSLPTIYHIKDGKYRVYNGNRDLHRLVDFIKFKEWEKIEPSSSWLSPNSFLIRVLSFLFKLTVYFKDFYTLLTETYGYPMWAVLALFIVSTLTFGLIVGLVFILIIDCVCSTKRAKDNGDDSLREFENDNDIGEEKTSGPASQEKSPKVSKKKAKKDN